MLILYHRAKLISISIRSGNSSDSSSSSRSSSSAVVAVDLLVDLGRSIGLVDLDLASVTSAVPPRTSGV